MLAMDVRTTTLETVGGRRPWRRRRSGDRTDDEGAGVSEELAGDQDFGDVGP